ncbi:MAG: hypothetical protein HDR13_11925 [Lachnospiraceae bacterium]|nr:hypothetical protein [Lachnospiraceae bacterium]
MQKPLLKTELVLCENGKIKVTADLIGDDDKKCLFAFRVRCNGRVKVECTPWSEDNSIVVDVDESGYYYAEVWVNIKDLPKSISNRVFCFPEMVRHGYRNWQNDFVPEKLPYLELYRLVPPFGEIAVVCLPESFSLTDLQGTFRHYTYDDENLQVITSCEKHTLNGRDYFFEGITRCEDRLIVGEADFCGGHRTPEEIDGQIGEFCMFYQLGGGFKFISDYFGFCRIYYYQDNDIFAACNSYHMLLMILKVLDVPLAINTDKVKAGFCEASTLFETNFSFDTDIKGIYCLPVDQRILFSNRQVIFEQTQLYDEIRGFSDYDENKYEEFIYRGVEEVIDNLKISLEHKGFDFVRMDLTGGMDSRLLYGAATRLPQSLTKKLYIRTEKNREKDFEIANTINTIYGFQYDDLPVSMFAEGITAENRLPQSPLSADMGGYYSGWIPRVVQRIDHALHLTGGAGEIVGRPFMKYWFPDASTVDDLCNAYSGRIGDIVIYPEGYEYFAESLKCVMEYLPGRTMGEKFDNHNLYFRNGHHFRLSYYTDTTCVGWTPLQSKSCFKAKIMAWNHAVDMKPQHDFLNLMNPLLSQLPYAGEKQNNEKWELVERLYKKGYPMADVKCDEDTSAFDRAMADKREASRYLPDPEEVGRARLEQDRLLSTDEAMLTCLRAILEYGGEFMDMGIYLYSWITTTSHKPELRHQRNTLNKRLLMLYYEIELIQEGKKSDSI